jgi:hypothetical protein
MLQHDNLLSTTSAFVSPSHQPAAGAFAETCPLPHSEITLPSATLFVVPVVRVHAYVTNLHMFLLYRPSTARRQGPFHKFPLTLCPPLSVGRRVYDYQNIAVRQDLLKTTMCLFNQHVQISSLLTHKL